MLRNGIAPDLLEILDTGSPGDIDFYSQYARHSGGPVLVLLCGTGRIAIPIARQNIPVIGLDGDAGSVELAKRKAAQAGVTRAMFIRGDATHFVSDSKHPLVMIPAGGLQQLLTLEEQRACLNSVRAAMQLGAKLVLDFPLLEPGLASEAEPLIKKQGDRTALVRQRRRYDSARQVAEDLIECHWLDHEGAVIKSQYATLHTRYMTPGEIVLLLEASGFTPVCFGGFDRRPLLPGSTRLVIEAERNR
ncbi:MAG TPA: class I SAM-dependent methyltransferase [Symbiobacteriaceae bacterium]|nr:class I SAM-dependent methyltransferase [Symbiobacteriaceae bacterium]